MGWQRYVFVAIALTLFHVFCRRWLSPTASFAAVSVFVALLPMTARNDLQESLPLLLVVFLVGLWCIREGWDLALAAVVLSRCAQTTRQRSFLQWPTCLRGGHRSQIARNYLRRCAAACSSSRQRLRSGY